MHFAVWILDGDRQKPLGIRSKLFVEFISRVSVEEVLVRNEAGAPE